MVHGVAGYYMLDGPAPYLRLDGQVRSRYRKLFTPSPCKGLLVSIDDDIARFDWSRIRTYLGYAEMVPYGLRGLAAASDDEEAARLGV